ncbi:hypothetical protein NDU88_003019 [Pleurodeles waltl]|uniref:Uncharacterized protein n=1 Tax=Pleurodeles waltl TaxID=8319 RepID=A0AAV7KXE2_PLEWA|nr:hypothetical protein NDU88_003019 [Pleurodeles waltl]
MLGDPEPSLEPRQNYRGKKSAPRPQRARRGRPRSCRRLPSTRRTVRDLPLTALLSPEQITPVRARSDRFRPRGSTRRAPEGTPRRPDSHPGPPKPKTETVLGVDHVRLLLRLRFQRRLKAGCLLYMCAIGSSVQSLLFGALGVGF